MEGLLLGEEGEEGDPAELALDPVDSLVSAKATGDEANSAPAPNATARAPTRPT